MDTPEFVAAADELAALARADRVAAMCAEGVWWRCHRSMIADYFKANGWTVLHILGMGEAKEHPVHGGGQGRGWEAESSAPRLVASA